MHSKPQQKKNIAIKISAMNKVLKKEENLVYLKNYQPSTFHILKTDLHFIVDESHTEVISKLSLKKVNTSAKELFRWY